VAIAGWIVDRSAAARSSDPAVSAQLAALADAIFICPMSQLEQLYSARSGWGYNRMQEALHDGIGDYSRIAEVRPLVVRRLGLQWQ
jgi:hypothetical protein